MSDITWKRNRKTDELFVNVPISEAAEFSEAFLTATYNAQEQRFEIDFSEKPAIKAWVKELEAEKQLIEDYQALVLEQTNEILVDSGITSVEEINELREDLWNSRDISHFLNVQQRMKTIKKQLKEEGIKCIVLSHCIRANFEDRFDEELHDEPIVLRKKPDEEFIPVQENELISEEDVLGLVDGAF